MRSTDPIPCPCGGEAVQGAVGLPLAWTLLLLAASGLLLLPSACSRQPLVVETFPLSGASLVEPSVRPRIVFASSATLNIQPAEARNVVLYDVTHGGRITVEGEVTADGATMTYVPTEPLPDGHDFRLEVKSEAVSGDSIDMVDVAEWPPEPVTWPLKLSFSTRSSPRVRATYLSEKKRLTIRFSQSMNITATTKELHVAEISGDPLATDPPIWATNLDVYLDIQTPILPDSIYVLTVGRRSVAQNGAFFDGDGNATGGEPSGTWSVHFTGSQRIIQSRYGAE